MILPHCPRRIPLSRHRDEKPVTASPLDSALTNCDARNSFRPLRLRAPFARRMRFYEKCRVSLPDLLSNLRHLVLCSTSLFSYVCALFCILLYFFSLTKNSTLLFSTDFALFHKNTGVGGYCTPSSPDTRLLRPLPRPQRPRPRRRIAGSIPAKRPRADG